jgi:hypothetical protein
LVVLTQQMLGWCLVPALLLLGRQCWLVLTPTGSASAALPAQQPAPTRQQQPVLPQQALSSQAQQWAVRLTAQALGVWAAWWGPALVWVQAGWMQCKGVRHVLQDSLRLAWL